MLSWLVCLNGQAKPQQSVWGETKEERSQINGVSQSAAVQRPVLLLFKGLCFIASRKRFLLETALEHVGHEQKSHHGKSCQSRAEKSEGVEILLVPEGVGEENGSWAQSAEHGAVEVEARAIGGGDRQVSQQRAVVEVHRREETIVQAQAQQELEPRSGPGHPERQEGQREERPVCGQGFEAPQHHLWICDWRTWPEKKKQNDFKISPRDPEFTNQTEGLKRTGMKIALISLF